MQNFDFAERNEFPTQTEEESQIGHVLAGAAS